MPPESARALREPSEKIHLLAEAIALESASLTHRLASESTELLPVVVGGVSRIEELLNDMLSFTRDLNSVGDESRLIPCG